MGKYGILRNNRRNKLHAFREGLFVKVGFEVTIFAYLRSSVCRTRHDLLCPYFHKSDGKGRGHFVMLT